MEQWILDCRSLIRQRDPKKFACAPDATRSALAHIAPDMQCFTSLLLTPSRCKPVSSSEGSLHFGFDCDAEGRPVGPGVRCWRAGTDCTGVFGIVRMVRHATDEATCGKRPVPYAECVATLRWFVDGVLADESEDFEFVAGAGVVPQAAEEGVLYMSEGSGAVFLCDPAAAFRENGLPRTSIPGMSIPAHAVVTLYIHLTSFRNPLTEAEKIDLTTELKNEGNTQMAAKQYDNAAKTYQKALHRLTSAAAAPSVTTKDETATLRERSKALKVTLLHNMAVAIASQDTISAQVASVAAGHCTRALAIDPGHAKSRYRRAMCLVQQREWQKALEDLDYLERRSIGDPAAIEALRARLEAERSGIS